MKKQRILCGLLALCMVLSILPAAVFAENAAVSASVSFTAQAYGAFVCPPQFDTAVPGDLAECYGYEDGIDPKSGVSVLDVLVRAHELTFGEDFTAETCTTLLNVVSGSITCIFGEETYNCGFTVNHLVPGSDTVATAGVQDGDFVELFLYQDSWAMDNYLWFVQDGKATYHVTAEPGMPVTLGVAGYCVGWYGYQYSDFDAVAAAGTVQEDVELALVNPETGELTALEATADESGNLQITFAEPGEYLLTAYATEDAAVPALLPLANVTVGHDYVAVVTEPTCTEQGYTTHTCSRCNDSYTDTYTDALGHDWDEGMVTKEATETEAGEKTYTCLRCGETKTEELPKTECPSAKFTDVDTSKWYHEGVDFAVSNGYIRGITDTTFEPNTEMNRAMLVTILHRVAGEPGVADTSIPFTDVAEGRYFTNAVKWAYSNNIVTGVTATTFEPQTPVTREQLATILYRYAGAEEVTEDLLKDFPDSASVHKYAQKAMNWAVSAGLITGNKADGVVYLDPAGSATRAQIAVILTRYLKDTMAASDPDAAIADTAAFLLRTVTAPTIGSVGGEWVVFGLSRSGYAVDPAYYEEYYDRLTAYVQEHEGVLSARRSTEYARVTIALTALGKDPENVAGYQLLTPLTDFDAVSAQGLNGCVFALLALDCGSYAPVENSEELRNDYVNYILERQLSDGGWNINSQAAASEPDTTAMALQALAAYTENPDVAEAVEKGVACLSAMQTENGGFVSGQEETAESAAQVLVAMCTLGIGQEDPRFVKNGHTVAENLLSFRCAGGGFAHSKGGARNQLATEQAFYALVALQRMEQGKTPLYAIR